ncbi:Glycosyltransferase involved in cell wall bisynthesis [Candidatus Electrothrix marina]|uniref:Glycosyltransferase involved in cell wall bisynthesis n=1 Tax=Candidatus Electrothrix marina TaxID=1859130 RepID=A0A444JAM0_9BACT|nr:Glycosyltransferase involved in cell wall bisynthesis [Candidatus Electrothrix marina]
MDPLVSIVTPVFNGEKYLGECIKSVMDQTYSNWQYVIVNNKSEDGTLAIAQKYAGRDSRIKVISNVELLPVMENFNYSIGKISPNSIYCKIICADDWIYPEFLSQMIELAQQNPKIGIVSSYRLHGDTIVPTEGMPYRKIFFSGHEMGRMNLLNGPYTFGSPTALLYRSEVVLSKSKFFNEKRTSGDTEACYETLKKWDFGFVPQILSFNRLHEKSVTSTSEYLKTNYPDHLYMLKKFGDSFLEKDEQRCRMNGLLKEYYRFLGRNPARFNDKQFLAYHKKSFENIGLKLDLKKVIWSFLIEGAKYLFLKIPKVVLRGRP